MALVYIINYIYGWMEIPIRHAFRSIDHGCRYLQRASQHVIIVIYNKYHRHRLVYIAILILLPMFLLPILLFNNITL
jgi:hypothetical protein